MKSLDYKNNWYKHKENNKLLNFNFLWKPNKSLIFQVKSPIKLLNAMISIHKLQKKIQKLKLLINKLLKLQPKYPHIKPPE